MHAILFELKRAFLATRKYLDERLQKYDITLTQFDIIEFLAKNGETEQRVLQLKFGITSACLTRTIESLVTNGWIEQYESPRDGRVKLVVPTPNALRIVEDIKRYEAFDIVEKCFKGFSSAEILELETRLHHLAVNMGDKSINTYR
ncbi:MarR family winged helix-turn-helix transcriptional regulator [Paenibacillus thalictri]|uniref:MarR family transcriptional regulator n=1 Tax=Paenibacillus thalictri TaxID=2527873 RepID=A0A4Q9DU07_9BACL|nr:MarR family winged helix-turn-helix transcriptional regulator [Paenibacillus thalictri]TBL79340.1 MarR family transcriptional regulator [Paenibacillus thalictri]